MSSAANATPVRHPGPRLLHHLLASTPATAGRPAIDALLGDGTRSRLLYSELHLESDALSRRLLHCVSASDGGHVVVPVLLRQTPGLYVTLLAILKAGAAFCALNLDAPPERVKFIIGDVSAKVLITTSDLVHLVPPDLAARVFVLDGPHEEAVVPLRDALPVTEKSLAYVMYTSGSTGTPKGVGVSHGAVTQSLMAHDRHIPSFHRFLQFAAPTFDVSVFEIFFPLFRGATLVSCDRGAMLNDLPGVIRQMEVDACELTPTVAGSLLRSRDAAPCLGLLLTIGEMLSEPVISEFGGREGRPSMLWAMYGPTEAAIHW
jgi:ferricrocin synthase